MLSYRVDVSSILEIVGGSVEVTDTVAIDKIEVGPETFLAKTPVTLDVTITNAGEGIVAYGRASVAVTAECARCLREFETTIEGDVEAFFVRPGDPMPKDQDADEVATDMTVDIGAAILAGLVIEAPFAPLHDPDCEGLCPTCGQDLNEGPCACPPQRQSGAFSVLEGITVEDDSES